MILPLSLTLKTIPFIQTYQVNRNKGTVLLLLGSLIDFVGNDGNGRCREFYLINLTHLFLYVGNAHSFGV